MAFYVLSVLSLATFMALFFTERKGLRRIFFFMVALVTLFLGMLQDNSFPQLAWLRYAVVVFWFLLGIIAPFIFFFMGIVLVFNGVQLIKEEGWSKRYGALIFFGGFILAMVILFAANYFTLNNVFIWKFMWLLGYGVIYFAFIFMGFLFATVRYSIIRPRYDKDFVIILGSELLPNGEIGPLLRSRLDKAIQFYRRQGEKTSKSPCYLIVSGGKGEGEPFSEAYAMKRYLSQWGVPEERIIEEDQSINTYENLLYSKAIMNAMKKDYKCLFITNNFHVFRSNVYARKVGLKVEGLGARTVLYYLPYAFFREFIALILIYRYLNAVLLGFVFVFGFIRVYL